MNRRLRLSIGVAAVALLAASSSARADVTAFVGTTSVSAQRDGLIGGAVSMSFIVFGVEGEFSTNRGAGTLADPQRRSYALNGFIQNPVPLGRLTVYGTLGGGLLRDTVAGSTSTTYATNVGGGAKVTLSGPLQLRLDYRVIVPKGTAAGVSRHRVYAGVNLKF